MFLSKVKNGLILQNEEQEAFQDSRVRAQSSVLTSYSYDKNMLINEIKKYENAQMEFLRNRS